MRVNVNDVGAASESLQPKDYGWFGIWRFSGLITGLLALTFIRVVGGLETFIYADFGQFAYPVAWYSRQCFWRGELPLWNPLSNCGTPFLAQWNTQTLYPFALFYYLLPMPWSYNLFCLLHLLIAGVGMYNLARSWSCNRLAAAVAGSVFAFNGVTWYGLMWPHLISALAWMPYVVLTMERSWRFGGRSFVIAAFFGVMQILSGGAEVILLTWGVLGLLWGMLFVHGEVFRGKLLWRGLATGCMVLGLGAVQLLPFLELLSQSQRQAGFGSAYGERGAIPLSGWANYVLPFFRCFLNPRGQFVQPGRWIASYYMGIGTVALGLLAIWRIRTWRVWLLSALAAFGTIMAIGDRTFFFSSLKLVFPIFGLMRFPSKFVILATFVMPLLAGLGLTSFSELHAQSRIKAHRVIFAIAVGLLTLLGALVWFAWKCPTPDSDIVATFQNAGFRALFLILITTCVAFIYSGAARERRGLLQVGLLILFWGDIFTHNNNLAPTLPNSALMPGIVRRSIGWGTEVSAGSTRVMENPVTYRRLLLLSMRDLVLDTSARRFAQYFDFNLLEDIPKMDGFYSMDLKNYSDIFGNFYYNTNDSQGLKDFLCISRINSTTNVAEWDSRNSCLPMITTGQKAVFASKQDTLEAIFSQDFDPRRTVYLPFEAQSSLTASAQNRSKILSTHFSSHKLEIDMEAEGSALIVVAQAFYPAWHAYVDQKSCPVWTANYAFQAVAVTPGRHRVVLIYQDRRLLCGAVISLACALMLGLLWFRLPVVNATHSVMPKVAPSFEADLKAKSSEMDLQNSARVTPDHRLFKVLWLLLSLGIALVLSELVLRLFFNSSLAVFNDERNLLYRYDEKLGWFPIANSDRFFLGSRAIRVTNNSEGFRDAERIPNENPGIIVLGDSFVWGFDVNASERFTEKLKTKHPSWNVYNFGVSGYGTDQEFMLLQDKYQDYRPKVVLLIFCTETDPEDNSTNQRWKGYYKPYYTIDNGLALHGVPVPRSERAFLSEHPIIQTFYVGRLLVRTYFKLTAPAAVQNPDPTFSIISVMNKYVESRGARLVVGLTVGEESIERFLQRSNIPFIDLMTELRYPSFGNHWTPEGHTFVCDKIDNLLCADRFMENEKSDAR